MANLQKWRRKNRNFNRRAVVLRRSSSLRLSDLIAYPPLLFFFSMPSLFSRSRTNSNPTKNLINIGEARVSPNPVASTGFDEFGRVASRQSTRGVVSVAVKNPKDKGGDRRPREKDKDKRNRTLSSPRERPDFDPEDYLSQIPDGSFLPLNLDRPWTDTSLDTDSRHKQQDYGYLSYERHVILGLEQVARLVDVVADELGTRGLTTPFIFSTLALDISAPAIKRLIQTFLQTCANPSSDDAERRWREEARFSGPHELGTCLRWGLARVVRIVGGQEVRGLLAWDHYLDFRDSEAGEFFDLCSIILSETKRKIKTLMN